MADSFAEGKSVSLDLELHCTSDNSQERASLLLSPPPETVADIKQRIEREFVIPRCLQNACLPDGQVLTDSQRVSGLYLRSGDSLLVTYYAKADIGRLREDIHGVLQPALTLLRRTKSVKQLEKDKKAADLLMSCQDTLRAISYKTLLPWGAPVSEANRRYLIQENGLDTALSIYSIVANLPWESRDWLLQNLEICCLSFLWNFAETGYARRLVVDKGGFELMLRSLMHQSEEEFLNKYIMHDIFDAAIGCISNYCEVECCQLPMAQNTVALNRLLQFTHHGSSINVFTKVLIANLFFQLSHSRQTHTYLVSAGILRELIGFFNIRNITIRYILGLTFVRLILFSPASIDEVFRPQISNCLKAVLSQVTASSVSQLEERFQYNWITILPFLEPAYATGAEAVKYDEGIFKKGTEETDSATSNGSRSEERGGGGGGGETGNGAVASTPSSTLSLCFMYAVFALNVEMLRSHNRKLVIQQDLLDYVVMLPWGMDSGWQDQCQQVIALFRKDHKLPVPRLASIAKAKLARTSTNGQIV